LWNPLGGEDISKEDLLYILRLDLGNTLNSAFQRLERNHEVWGLIQIPLMAIEPS
jgi:hypothetical protein